MRINLLPGANSIKTPSKPVIPKIIPNPDLKSNTVINGVRPNIPVIENPDEVKLEYAKFDALQLGDVGDIVEVKQVKSNTSKLTNVLIYICWGIFLLGSMVFLLGEYLNYDLSKGELISLENQLVDYRAYLAKVKMENDKSIQNQKNQDPESRPAFITHLYQPWLAVFNDLASVLPEEIWLTGIEGASQGNITVNGRSLTYTAVANYISNLQGIPLFDKVELKEVHRVSSKTPDYLFTIEIKTGGNGLE